MSDAAPIDGLREPQGPSGPNNSPADLRRAAEAFESILVQMMVQAMRKAQVEDGLFGGGPGTHVYEGLFDRYLSERVSEGSPFGIARMLEEQWSQAVDGNERAREALAAVEKARATQTYGDTQTYGSVIDSRSQVPESGTDKNKDEPPCNQGINPHGSGFRR